MTLAPKTIKLDVLSSAAEMLMKASVVSPRCKLLNAFSFRSKEYFMETNLLGDVSVAERVRPRCIPSFFTVLGMCLEGLVILLMQETA
jgi:hypothetical protein